MVETNLIIPQKKKKVALISDKKELPVAIQIGQR